ncbi:MAG: hypothetical protein ACLQD8_01095, partial [Thermoplasmata archaeon]
MAADTVVTSATEDEAAPKSLRRGRRPFFSPWLRVGAAMRKGSSEPRPVKLARLGVSGQGADRDVTPLPPITDPAVKQIDLAPIRPGFSFVRVVFDTQRNEFLYEVIEPPLTPIEHELADRLRTVLVAAFEPLPDHEIATKQNELRRMVDAKLQEWELAPGPTTKGRILYYLERDFIGYGIVDVPMTDTEVEDISCDGVGIPLYIYHRKHGSIRSNLKFLSSKELDDYVIWLAQRSGKHISVASPVLDATVPDGSRLQATLGMHVTKRGSTFTVRRFRDNPFTPVDLCRTPPCKGWNWQE